MPDVPWLVTSTVCEAFSLASDNKFLRGNCVFKKILKWVLNAGLAVLGIAVVLAGLELLVNSRLFDEAPNPEIAAFMQIEASRVPDEQNAYFQLVGLAAPESAQ